MREASGRDSTSSTSPTQRHGSSHPTPPGGADARRSLRRLVYRDRPARHGPEQPLASSPQRLTLKPGLPSDIIDGTHCALGL